jgi:hypothetical protein
MNIKIVGIVQLLCYASFVLEVYLFPECHNLLMSSWLDINAMDNG